MLDLREIATSEKDEKRSGVLVGVDLRDTSGIGRAPQLVIALEQATKQSVFLDASIAVSESGKQPVAAMGVFGYDGGKISAAKLNVQTATT